jgi:lysozyme family protein
VVEPAGVDDPQRRLNQLSRIKVEHVADGAPALGPLTAAEEKCRGVIPPVGLELFPFQILKRLAQHGAPQSANALHNGVRHTTPKRYNPHEIVSLVMSGFDVCLAFTLREEGGYQCVPGDGGNWSGGGREEGQLIGTCHGISAPTLAAWLGPEHAASLTPDYMQALPVSVAGSILGAQYWLPCGGPNLPRGVDLMVFDHAVNAGVRASVLLLQRAVDVAADGYVGPRTRAAVWHANPGALVDFLARMQEAAYRAMPGAPMFLDGWLARLARRRAAAHGRLQGSIP